MHVTSQWELAMYPAANWRKQQVRMDRLRRDYNHERPHEALGWRSRRFVTSHR
ncbi:MAG: integrase core domain-containing protein [Acidobacteriota bacterium]